MPVYLLPFDPTREFKALRFFRFQGQIISRHDPFPLEGVEDRKAKQLYETRFIGYADEKHSRDYPPKPPVAPASTAPRTDPTGGEREALIKKLADRYQKKTLLNKAKGLDGVTPKSTKIELVTALLDAGRANADGLA